MTHKALLSLGSVHLLDASTSLIICNVETTDSALFHSHAGVNIDVLQLNEEWAIRGSDKPTVYLPAEVQEDEQRSSKVQLEESGGIQIGASNRIQRDIELGDQSENANQQAEI